MLASSALLSNTVEGMKIRVRRCSISPPSGVLTFTYCTIRVPGGAGVMNLAFTQPWPTPPGLAVARV